MTTVSTRARRTRDPGIAVGLVATTVVAAGVLAATVPVTDPAWRFGIVAGALAVFAALVADPVAVICGAGLAWLVVNGFLVDRFGELSWHGLSDMYRALMLMAAGGVGLLAGRVGRGMRRGDD